MKIVILGAGGVGGYIGARLAAAGQEVTFVARGAHLDAIRKRGLLIRSALGDVHLSQARAVGSVDEAHDAELVVVAVKLWDTESAAKQLQRKAQRGATVVSFQNGVEKDDLLRRYVPADSIMGGVCYIASVISSPGVITHNGKMQRLVFGEYDGKMSERALRFLEACGSAGIEAEVSTNIEKAIWEKFVLLVGLSGATSTIRQSLGPILADSHARALFAGLMQEAAEIGRQRGVDIARDFVTERLTFCESLPQTMTSSMHHDLESGHRLEMPWLSGYVADAGAESHIPTPYNAAVRSILSIYANGSAATPHQSDDGRARS